METKYTALSAPLKNNDSSRPRVLPFTFYAFSFSIHVADDPPLAEQRPQVLESLPRCLLLRALLPRHGKIRKRFFLTLQVEHLLLETVLHNEPLDGNGSRLPKTVHAVDGLGFSGGVELGLHDEGLVGFGQVKTETAGADGYQDDCNGIVLVERLKGAVSSFARHAAVETDIVMAFLGEGDLDEVEMGGPGREDDAVD